MLKRIFKKRINEIYVKYMSKDVLITDDMANFFGLESLGTWKVRGVIIITYRKRIILWNVETQKRVINSS